LTPFNTEKINPFSGRPFLFVEEEFHVLFAPKYKVEKSII